MQAISLERSNLAQTTVVSLVTFAALALLGLVLAYWTWAWLAPRPEPRALAAAQTDRRMEAAYGLFGNAQRDRNGAAPTGIAVRLLGVVAGKSSGSRSQSSYAVLRLDAKQVVAVREGGEIGPGVRLLEVHADHVVLERRGVRETLAWPEQDKSVPPPVPGANK
jgi:general secretion pathway protein C